MTVDLVPSTDLAPSLPSRVVTVNVLDVQEGGWAAGQSVHFSLVGDVHVPADQRIVLGRKGVRLDLPEGRGQVRLPVWTSATGEWAVKVQPSWTPHPYFVRVPAGSGSVDLSQINPLVDVPPGLKQWLLTNASVSATEGAAWGASVSVAGGNAHFAFTFPPGGVAYGRGNVSSGSLNTLTDDGVYRITATAVTDKPANVLGSLEVVGGTYVTQTYTSWEAQPRIWSRRQSGGVWSAWTPVSWLGAEAPTAADLNTYITSGYSGVVTGTAVNRPVPLVGALEVFAFGSGVLQRYVTWEVEPRVFMRRGAVSGGVATWSAWHEYPTLSDVQALIAPISEAAGASASGSKVIPLAVNAPGTTVAQSQTTGAVRWVRRWAHMPTRIRVHVSNRNPANAVNGGAAQLVGVKVGVGTAAGGMSNPVTALGAATIPADGTELVSPWIDCPGDDGDHLALALAWTGGTTQQVNQGGGWVADATNGWDAATAPGSFAQATPFYVWIEAEVPARVPVLVVNGDSISIGTATAHPVMDAWPAIYALGEGALPVFFSQHGSTMTNWTSSSTRWSSLYPGITVRADAVIAALGQNDLTAGVTLATLQTRFADVAAAIAARFPNAPLYLAALTPSTKTSDVEATRRSFNTWLRGLPNGARGFFDFAAAVGDASDEDLNPTYSADGLHPNTAGQQVLAALVQASPVTPYTLTQKATRALAALA